VPEAKKCRGGRQHKEKGVWHGKGGERGM